MSVLGLSVKLLKGTLPPCVWNPGRNGTETGVTRFTGPVVGAPSRFAMTPELRVDWDG
jgi:hypothetical protein